MDTRGKESWAKGSSWTSVENYVASQREAQHLDNAAPVYQVQFGWQRNVLKHQPVFHKLEGKLAFYQLDYIHVSCA